MSDWTNRPAPNQHPTQLQLLRVPPSKTIIAIITSDDAIGRDTHYWKGRTRVCTHPTCEPCDAHHAPRWYGYLAVVAPTMQAPTILEITAACVNSLNEYLQEYPTLRGAEITIRRANKKANSRLIATLKPSPYRDGKLPAAPNVITHLCRIWEIPLPPQLAIHGQPPHDGQANSHDRHSLRCAPPR